MVRTPVLSWRGKLSLLLEPVRRSARPAHDESIAAFVRDELGVNSSVASPIVVDAKVWGLLFAHSRFSDEPFRPDAESRIRVLA